MGKRILGLALLAGLLALSPVIADGKKPAAKDDKTKHVDSDTLPNAAYTGNLLNVPDAEGSFSAVVDVVHYEPKNPKHPEAYAKAMQAVARDQEHVAKLEQEYANAKKPADQARKLKQLETAQAQVQKQLDKAANDIKTVTEHQTVDFQISRDVKVRVMLLPPRFDDDGKVKPYTDDEKKALKGDNANLPGYDAKFSDLKVNDVVRIRLWRPMTDKSTTTPPPSDSQKDASDSKDKAKDPTLPTKKSLVTEIVILNDDKADKDKKDTTKDSPGK